MVALSMQQGIQVRSISVIPSAQNNPLASLRRRQPDADFAYPRAKSLERFP
jgi:hypothetical protein